MLNFWRGLATTFMLFLLNNLLTLFVIVLQKWITAVRLISSSSLPPCTKAGFSSVAMLNPLLSDYSHSGQIPSAVSHLDFLHQQCFWLYAVKLTVLYISEPGGDDGRLLMSTFV